MKKTVALILALALILVLGACSSNEPVITPPTSTASKTAPNTEEADDDIPVESLTEDSIVAEQSIDESIPEESTPAASAPKTKILVAYFSVPETDGVDAVAGASRVVVNGSVVGNTQFIAEAIQKATESDLVEIKSVQEYPGSHSALLDFAANEKNQNARPDLSTQIGNLADYDVIFLGYPNWNADLPMPLYTFLETTDLSGKTIIPFCPHGGSGFSNTISTIAELQPNATVLNNGFAVSRDSVASSIDDINSWVEELAIVK